MATLKEQLADPTGWTSTAAVREAERKNLRRAYDRPEVRERIATLSDG